MANAPTLRELADRLEKLVPSGACTIVAIDGCGGAGKSTLAVRLQKVWTGSTVVHTDDFASWDCPLDWWPRLLNEVLEPLSKGLPARFQKFDWIAQELGDWVTVETNRLILEGVSSSRNEFRPYLAFAIWIETPRLERLKRGLERDGEAMRDQWEAWMAAEYDYVASHDPIARANLVLSGAEHLK